MAIDLCRGSPPVHWLYDSTAGVIVDKNYCPYQVLPKLEFTTQTKARNEGESTCEANQKKSSSFIVMGVVGI